MRNIGTVACFNKTYGFINRDDKLPDIFFVGSALTVIGLSDIGRGTRVEFDAVTNDRKPGHLMAINFTIIDGENR